MSLTDLKSTEIVDQKSKFGNLESEFAELGQGNSSQEIGYLDV